MKTLVMCMGSACFARGNGSMLEAVREYLQEYAPNDLQVKGELCCDRCTGGPNIFFDEQQVNVDSAAGLVSFLKQRCK